ncbi:hypothetical protein ACFQ60_00270 [Streptomyces zhihengii]
MCNRSESSPLIVTRTDPRVIARVQTQVQPDPKEEKEACRRSSRSNARTPPG